MSRSDVIDAVRLSFRVVNSGNPAYLLIADKLGSELVRAITCRTLSYWGSFGSIGVMPSSSSTKASLLKFNYEKAQLRLD